jgi:hypothetical protein
MNCKHCKKYFNSDGALGQHTKAVHHYKCDICGKICATNNALKRHIEDKHPLYVCEECGDSFDSEGELDDHVETEHNKCDEFDEPYFGRFECKTCKRGEWYSANVFVKALDPRLMYYRQQCLRCKRYVEPEDVRPLDGSGGKNTKGHSENFCERFKEKGVPCPKKNYW